MIRSALSRHPLLSPGVLLAGAIALSACTGAISEPGLSVSGGGGGGGAVTPPETDLIAVSGLRRLSVAEYRLTVFDLLGVDPANSVELFPQDPLTPFDNDFTLQTASEPLIVGAELVAGDLADEVVASTELRGRIVPCAPAGAADTGCYRQFVSTFGRRALRRPLTDAEVTRFEGLLDHAVVFDDFWVGVNAGLRAFLQHPEFLYRVEVGRAVPGQAGVFQLGPYETATRLSYFLWGTTPPDWLLDAAEAGELNTEAGLAAAADRLLDDDRALPRLSRFHAMWLGYDKLNTDGIFGDMHQETAQLINRVVLSDNRPWTDLLTSTETYLTPELADHYGLDSPGASADWVSYGSSGRGGLLSHGTFLSAVPKFGDTSPTQRGLLVRRRLFCQDIPPPPPDLMVDIDEPPPDVDENACKTEKYYMATEPACAACHVAMDNIGFGLESYDQTGRFRTTENGREDCVITGDGDFQGVGSFNGPAELGALAVTSGLVEECVATHMYQFAAGRTELNSDDQEIIRQLVSDASSGDGLRLRELIRGYVTSDAFTYRRDED